MAFHCKGNRYHRHYSGFSLFELVVVISIVGILFAVAINKYRSSIEESQGTVISFQANAFLRAIENVRAISTIQNSAIVDMGDGFIVYLNRYGWPIATNKLGLHKNKNATKRGCQSLWQGFFRETNEVSQINQGITSKSFNISLIDNYICRYELSRKQEGSYFFDYDVITGDVVITSEEL